MKEDKKNKSFDWKFFFRSTRVREKIISNRNRLWVGFLRSSFVCWHQVFVRQMCRRPIHWHKNNNDDNDDDNDDDDDDNDNKNESVSFSMNNLSFHSADWRKEPDLKKRNNNNNNNNDCNSNNRKDIKSCSKSFLQNNQWLLQYSGPVWLSCFDLWT